MKERDTETQTEECKWNWDKIQQGIVEKETDNSEKWISAGKPGPFRQKLWDT